MTEKRMKLSLDEVAIIEGLRHERAIYNQALTDVLTALCIRQENNSSNKTIGDTILELRK